MRHISLFRNTYSFCFDKLNEITVYTIIFIMPTKSPAFFPDFTSMVRYSTVAVKYLTVAVRCFSKWVEYLSVAARYRSKMVKIF